MIRRAPAVFLLSLCLLLAALLAACNASPFSPGSISLPEGVLFSDQFVPGETGRWRLEGDQNAWATLQDEQLVITVEAPETVQYATLDGESFSNFVLDVQGTILAGEPQNSYGVLFRMAGPNQFYRFEITGSGLFTVERQDGPGNWTRLTSGWVDSTAIAQGVGERNRLRISAVGDQLTFTVNDQLLLELTDATYLQGNIALDAGTFDRPGIQVAFDNLVIAQPTQP